MKHKKKDPKSVRSNQCSEAQICFFFAQSTAFWSAVFYFVIRLKYMAGTCVEYDILCHFVHSSVNMHNDRTISYVHCTWCMWQISGTVGQGVVFTKATFDRPRSCLCLKEKTRQSSTFNWKLDTLQEVGRGPPKTSLLVLFPFWGHLSENTI